MFQDHRNTIKKTHYQVLSFEDMASLVWRNCLDVTILYHLGLNHSLG